MKLAPVIVLALLPVVALATQPGQGAESGTVNEPTSVATQQQPATSAQVQDTPINEPIDPLPISKRKCLAVDKHGFCSQWASD